MILFIDTSDFHNLTLAIVQKSDVKEFHAEVAFNENYKTIAFLQTFLKRQKIGPKQLRKIVVCSGPGSFTGIRVGVSVAQAMGFTLHIPVIAIPKSKVPTDLRKLETMSGAKTVTLHYGRKPNITKPKKKARV